jgi:adenylosuccinate lyase
MLATLTKLTEGLIVYPDNMKRNMELSLGMWHSQTVLLALIRKGLSREAAYELVQRNAMDTWKAKHAGEPGADFKKQLLSDPEVAKLLPREELDELCSLDFHYKQVESRFKSLGI